MPSETFQHSTATSASPSEILTALEQAGTWQGIGPIEEVWDAVHDDGRLVGFSWNARAAGKTWTGTARRVEADPNSMSLELDTSELSGVISVAASAASGATELAVELQANSKGMFAGMFWGVIADALRRGLPEQVEQFAESLSES